MYLFFFSQAKKAREQAALKNAQSLFEELDAEREKKERREKAAAKKRNKRKEKKRKEQAEKMVNIEYIECRDKIFYNNIIMNTVTLLSMEQQINETTSKTILPGRFCL